MPEFENSSQAWDADSLAVDRVMVREFGSLEGNNLLLSSRHVIGEGRAIQSKLELKLFKGHVRAAP